MDPPSRETMISAIKQLYLLGALNETGDLSKVGDTMSIFPLSPHLARALVASFENGCSEELLIITSLLSVEEIFITPRSKEDISKASQAKQQLQSLAKGGGDHMTLLCTYLTWADEINQFSVQWTRDNFLHFRNLKAARSIRQQLNELALRHGLKIKSCKYSSRDDELCFDQNLIIKCLAEGYFLHSAKRHMTQSVFYPLGVGKGENLGFFVHPSSVFFEDDYALDCVIFHEIVYTTKAYMRCISPLDISDIEIQLKRMETVDLEKLCGPLEKPTASCEDIDPDKEKKREREDEEESKEENKKEKQDEKRSKKEEEERDQDKAAQARARFLERQNHKKKK